jgi:hypothetical protein
VRSRNIKPGFFVNEDLAEIDPVGRLLFIGLWCLADRDGKLEDRPKRIKGELFRFDNISVGEIDGFLDKLASLKMLIRYEVDDNKYIKIINFSKHQKPHYAEKPSIIPGNCTEKPSIIPGNCTEKPSIIPGNCTEKPSIIPGNCTEKPGIKGGVKPPDSLIADSLNKTPPTPPAGGNGCDPDFLVWWEEAPPQMRKDQEAAKREWRRQKRRGKLPPLPVMLATLRAQKGSEAWQKEEGRFIPLPENYLAKGRWQDESVQIREPTPGCRECRGSGYRRARPGEAAVGGQVRCGCKAEAEVRGP